MGFTESLNKKNRILSFQASGFGSPGADYESPDISDQLVDFLVPRPVSSFYFWMDDEGLSPYLEKGDLLIIDRSLTPKSGDLVIVEYQGELLVRFLSFFKGQKNLEVGLYTNQNFSASEENLIKITELDEFAIFGVISFFIRPVRRK